MKNLHGTVLFTILAVQTSFVSAGSNHDHPHTHADGQSHSHKHGYKTPHTGIEKPLWGLDGIEGYVELKLHDDKGDLELWLTNWKEITPYDLPLGTQITVTFTELDKTVELSVRNKAKNEDEDGQPNIRGNKTNYFIFPGDTGVDASFLMGKSFSSDVIISFEIEGVRYATSSFTLTPHTH